MRCWGRTGEGSWAEHSRGVIVQGAEDSGNTELAESGFSVPDFAGVDLAERRSEGEALYRWAKKSGLEYGPAFQRVERIVTKRLDGVLMAEAQVAPAEDQGEFLLHPAVLDACFQAMILMRGRIPGLLVEDLYLPSGLGKMWMAASEAAAVEDAGLLAEAVFRGASAGMEELVFDLRLKTDGGQVLAAFEGFRITRVEARGAQRHTENVHRLGWMPIEGVADLAPGAGIGRHWLIFADNEGGAGGAGARRSRAARLARLLTAQGGRCTLVWEGAAFRALGDGERRLDLLGADEYVMAIGEDRVLAADLDRLLGLVAAEAGKISDVLDLWPVSGGDGASFEEVESLDVIWAAQAGGVKFVPALVQALTRADWGRQGAFPPKLWLVTAGTQWVEEIPGAVRLAGSPVWGMGAVAMRGACGATALSGGSGIGCAR